jgi:hypothetical protein
MSKEKTLSLLANRICEECAKNADDSKIVKHGCCVHFITSVYNEFFPPFAGNAKSSSGQLGQQQKLNYSSPWAVSRGGDGPGGY